MYKVIVANHGSNRDLNGNCYWYSVLINAYTNERIYLSADYEHEIQTILFCDYQLDSRQVYEHTEMHPIREWDRITKGLAKDRVEFYSYQEKRKAHIELVLKGLIPDNLTGGVKKI